MQLDLLTGLKHCANPECTETDPRNFYRNRAEADGLTGYCKKCTLVKQQAKRGPSTRTRRTKDARGYREFWARVRKTETCWVWTGPVGDNGYACFAFDKKNQVVHRIAYEHLVGPIPDGKELDHTCHDPRVCPGGNTCPHRRCVNPDHLEPVTSEENVRRAGNWERNKTHCPKGHPYDEQNTGPSHGWRRCRACHREKQNARYLQSVGQLVRRPRRKYVT